MNKHESKLYACVMKKIAKQIFENWEVVRMDGVSSGDSCGDSSYDLCKVNNFLQNTQDNLTAQKRKKDLRM